jgi:20S proteasome subunit alpha 6
MAIGARSQSARTYLERNLDAYLNCSREELVRHALLALRECLPSDSSLTSANTTVAIVGENEAMQVCDDEKCEPFIALVQEEAQGLADPAVGDGDTEMA